MWSDKLYLFSLRYQCQDVCGNDFTIDWFNLLEHLVRVKKFCSLEDKNVERFPLKITLLKDSNIEDYKIMTVLSDIYQFSLILRILKKHI